MNSRERFLETLSFGQPDRVPLFEEGIREEVLTAWRKQGMPAATALSSLFLFDQHEELALDVDPRPEPASWPTDYTLLELLEQRLDASDPKRLPSQWPQRVRRWKNRDHVLTIRVNRGLFQTLGVQGWSRFEEVIYMLKDKPQLVRDVMRLQGTFTARLLERLLGEITIDAAIFSEPIAGNHGSLISPAMFEELVLVGYVPILEILRQFGVKHLIMRTYANPQVLLPAIVNGGFNCLWACESPPGSMAYQEIRQEYGRDLRLIGGIDVDVLLADMDNLSSSIFDGLRPLLDQGGFIPLADGRVRSNISFETYSRYRKMLTDLVSG